MQWIDRQRSSNITDRRTQLSAGSIGDLIVQLESIDQTLTALENQAAGIPPLPRRRPMGTPDDWMGQARLSAQKYGDRILSGTPPLPQPRPERPSRRFNRGQE